jgi:sec-independent protein translocase protein TatA
MFHTPSFMELVVVGIIAVVLFGKRLPDVGKNLGKGIVEFKKGLKGIEEEVNVASAQRQPPLQTRLPDQPTQPAIPSTPGYKFDPYTGKPVEQTTTTTTSV